MIYNFLYELIYDFILKLKCNNDMFIIVFIIYFLI